MKIVATQTPPVGATMPLWRQEMKRAIRDPGTLITTLDLDPQVFSLEASQSFPLFAPLPFVRRIQPGQPQDPLLLQLLPQPEELNVVPGFSADPVRDEAASQGHGVIQKYPGRALLVLTGACAIHCRYCFRREYPYAENQAWRKHWPATCDRLRQDSSLTEVILSGGDPLTLDDAAWCEILGDLSAIEHLQRIRIHTRLPIMIPCRITSNWLQQIEACRLKTVLVLHANHAAELDAEVQAYLQQASLVATLLNQSVLLRGVNHSVTAQQELAERLLECRVIPYYLNLLDRVSGSAHFEVSEHEGVELIKQLRQRLPGYLVPRLVRDEGQGLSKRVVV
jgi:EF-P beta-lysylation protein EpmB